MIGNAFYAAAWLVVTATLAAYTLRARVPAWWGRSVAVAGVGFFLAAAVAAACGPFVALDFRSFWEFGRAVNGGGDAVALIASHPLPPLNPPSAYPFYSGFALLPRGVSLVVWVAVSGLTCVALVPLSYRTLADRGVPGAADTKGWGVGLVSAAFVLSNATRSMLQSGQMAAPVALGLIAALAAQSRGRPGWAGFWLLPGTIKPNSTLPFLLLFHRRRDLKTWAVLAALVVAVCLAYGWGRDPGRRVSVYLTTVAKHGRPGAVNDVAFTGPQTAGMVGLDYAFYRLGFRAPGAADRAQLAALVALGGALAWRVLRRPAALPTGGDCAQVALYSTVFLYHRTHDFVVLALPLSYAVLRARETTGAARRAYAAAAGSVVLALSQQRKAVELLEAALKGRTDALARVAQAVALPYATWLVLAAMLLLALGDRRSPAPVDAPAPGR